MRIFLVPISFEGNFSLADKGMKRKILRGAIMAGCFFCSVPHTAFSEPSDFSTHHSDHAEDAQVETLPMVHVHGLRLNKDQQLGPVPQRTPWPTIPRQLEGKELDDWLKARFLVSIDGDATVVILQPAAHRELTQEALLALKQWTFLPQMDGDQPVEGEVSIRIHFRTQ
jgi:TonB family protein